MEWQDETEFSTVKPTLQIIVFMAGCVCIFMAGRYLVFFARSDKHVGRSMVFLLAEQIVTTICTMVFSINSLAATLTGRPESEWNSISFEAAVALRLAMFGTMIWSTWHLSRSVKQVIEGSKMKC